MTLITNAQRQKLLENGRAQRATLDQKEGAIDFEPVVKLFTPDGNATWFLTELDPNGEYLAFGLCDLGLGEPELGYVSLHELAAARGSYHARTASRSGTSLPCAATPSSSTSRLRRDVRWLALAFALIVFGITHGAMWAPGIIAGAAYGMLAIRTNKLGEAIAAHATTNALVAATVLIFDQWQLW